jgi:hypothetical protein
VVGVGVAAAFIALFAIGYYALNHSGSSSAEKAGVENPGNASRQKVSNPLEKSVEVVGIRMMTENKQPVVKFVVVNHSSAEIADLSANVNLWASTARSEEDAVGSFKFTIPSLGPGQSVDMSEPLKTKKKMYELPDWQNTTTDIQITSPTAQ